MKETKKENASLDESHKRAVKAAKNKATYQPYHAKKTGTTSNGDGSKECLAEKKDPKQIQYCLTVTERRYKLDGMKVCNTKADYKLCKAQKNHMQNIHAVGNQKPGDQPSNDEKHEQRNSKVSKTKTTYKPYPVKKNMDRLNNNHIHSKDLNATRMVQPITVTGVECNVKDQNESKSRYGRQKMKTMNSENASTSSSLSIQPSNNEKKVEKKNAGQETKQSSQKPGYHRYYTNKKYRQRNKKKALSVNDVDDQASKNMKYIQKNDKDQPKVGCADSRKHSDNETTVVKEAPKCIHDNGEMEYSTKLHDETDNQQDCSAPNPILSNKYETVSIKEKGNDIFVIDKSDDEPSLLNENTCISSNEVLNGESHRDVKSKEDITEEVKLNNLIEHSHADTENNHNLIEHLHADTENRLDTELDIKSDTLIETVRSPQLSGTQGDTSPTSLTTNEETNLTTTLLPSDIAKLTEKPIQDEKSCNSFASTTNTGTVSGNQILKDNDSIEDGKVMVVSEVDSVVDEKPLDTGTAHIEVDVSVSHSKQNETINSLGDIGNNHCHKSTDPLIDNSKTKIKTFSLEEMNLIKRIDSKRRVQGLGILECPCSLSLDGERIGFCDADELLCLC